MPEYLLVVCRFLHDALLRPKANDTAAAAATSSRMRRVLLLSGCCCNAPDIEAWYLFDELLADTDMIAVVVPARHVLAVFIP